MHYWDNERTAERARRAVNAYFAKFGGGGWPPSAVPARSQLEGFALLARLYDHEKVRTDLVRHQQQRLHATAEANGGKLGPKDTAAMELWGVIETEINELEAEIAESLGPSPERPEPGSPNMHELLTEFNTRKKEYARAVSQRMREALSEYSRHFLYHFLYKSKMLGG